MSAQRPALRRPRPSSSIGWEISGFCWGCRSEEHTSELQSRFDLVCRLLLEKKKTTLPFRQVHHLLYLGRPLSPLPTLNRRLRAAAATHPCAAHRRSAPTHLTLTRTLTNSC